MIVQGWHADGFGVLHDQGVDGLGAGVTVLLGENEAGKSTQLAFLRAILFGFADGRTNEPPYEPLNGGSHGGLVLLRDGAGGLWRVERHAEKKRLRVVRPDGAAGDAADLAAVLCGVDKDLFQSVYAFDLAQLSSLDALDPKNPKGMRDRIFGQALVGSGPAPKAVSDAFDKRLQELLKQGLRANAVLNDRVRAVLAKEDELRDAEREAEGYAALVEEEAAQEELVTASDAELDGLRERRAHLAKLIELQPALFDSHQLAEELARLPYGDEALPARVASLVDELTGLVAVEAQAGTQREAERRAHDDLAEALERLGEGWTVERVRAFEASVAVRDELERRRRELEDAEAAVRERETRSREEAQAAAERAAELERAQRDEPAGEPPPTAETLRLQQMLAGLRADLQDLQAVELAAGSGAPGLRLVAPLAWVFAAAAGVAGLATGFLVDWRLGAALLVAAVLFAVLGAVARQTGAHGERVGAGSDAGAAGAADDAGTDARTGGGDSLARRRQALAAAAAALALPPRPTNAQIGAREAELVEQQARRAEWEARKARIDALRDAAATAARKAVEAAEALQTAQGLREQVRASWADWAGANGLDAQMPATAIRVFDAVEAGKRADRAALAARQRLDEIAAEGTSWAARAREALDNAGIDVATDGGPSGAEAPIGGVAASAASSDSLRSALRTLHGQLQHRAEVELRLAQAQQQLERGLGPAERAQAAYNELGAGDATAWQTELDGLEGPQGRIAERQAERDRAVEARRVAHDGRAALEVSAHIPTLQAERASLLAALAGEVREYRLLAAARRLIDDTFKRYARERQPAVLADASQAFAAVTGGAYTRIDPFDARGEDGISVVAADEGDGPERLKSPDQLSRGTREQLYVVMRLALASDLARRRTPPEHLPLVMDDCLVNFDPRRAAATARLLVDWAREAQCLLFTCHPETADLLLEVSDGEAKVVSLGTLDASAATPA